MTISDFLEKAGYDPVEVFNKNNLYKILLFAKTWEAVGKVEGWDEDYKEHVEMVGGFLTKGAKTRIWTHKMFDMVNHLIDGGTIESYLETL